MCTAGTLALMDCCLSETFKQQFLPLQNATYHGFHVACSSQNHLLKPKLNAKLQKIMTLESTNKSHVITWILLVDQVT